MNLKIKDTIQENARIIKQSIAQLLSSFPKNEELFDAMRYSTLANSSCIRGCIVIEVGLLCNLPFDDILNVATALELIHAFSLIHDDLPSMDNSDMRRNQPSCHLKFSESTAILAGNAILVLAYQMLSNYGPAILQASSRYVMEMLLGQTHDLNKHTGISQKQINREKTGALFAFTCSCTGYLMSHSKTFVETMENFGYELGMLFQIADDIKDGDTIASASELEEQLYLCTHLTALEKIEPDIKSFLSDLCRYIVLSQQKSSTKAQ